MSCRDRRAGSDEVTFLHLSDLQFKRCCSSSAGLCASVSQWLES